MVKSVKEWSGKLSLLNGIIIPKQCLDLKLFVGPTQDESISIWVYFDRKVVNFYIGLKAITVRRRGTFTARINGQIHTRKNISVTKSGSIMFTIDRPTEETIELQEFTISDD
jgi:hypothetical protein